MSRREHKLKTASAFYQALQDGRKTFEIRFNDRDYRVGDYLHLCQWDGERFTGRNVWRRVSYILTWGEFPGLASGYVCMGFDEPASAQETSPALGKRCRHNQPADSCDTCYAVDG